jgi:oligopeptide transport system substrate-binding protein
MPYNTVMKRIFITLLLGAWTITGAAATWNSPHRSKSHPSTGYAAFSGAPKTLDPARAYSSDEIQFIAQIYEPPLQYHLLKRPYQLVPLTLVKMPVVTYFDRQGRKTTLRGGVKKIARTQYDLFIQPGMYYQPHPAFVKETNGRFLYHHLTQKQVTRLNDISDFKKTATREVTAADYVYEIKRLASPALHSPILAMMEKHIMGLKSLAKQLNKAYQRQRSVASPKPYLDLRQYPLLGVKVMSRYHYRITIKGLYRQFEYWLAMPFFSPIPWEADVFYSQRGLQKDSNINFNWYPVGSGPFYLVDNNPNKQMVLRRNPHFHGETFPTEGMPEDQQKGYLAQAGQALPLTDQFIFSLDRESIPRWNKFLQGYYDRSGISADSYDQAVKLDANGQAVLTDELKQKGLRLETSVSPAVFYIGFNMLDKLVGGDSVRARKLRQAIAIAIDYEEYIAIFMNGRGKAAHGPIPPGIFGYQEGAKGINDVVYFWDPSSGKAKRRPLSTANALMRQAGYPNGVDVKTGKPLILNYDATSSGSPDDQARFNWMRKQFAKLGIQLNIRSTQYNRFRDKVRRGNAQIFSWGWLADYPDPENFLFLLYGANGKVKSGGENATNYSNPKVNALFEAIKDMPNGKKRQAKISQILKRLRNDAPWIWGVHPIDFTLSHQWQQVIKPNAMANNTLKYQKIDARVRQQKRQQWNAPVLWPLILFAAVVLVMLIPLCVAYWRRDRRPNISRYE